MFPHLRVSRFKYRIKVAIAPTPRKILYLNPLIHISAPVDINDDVVVD